MIDPADLDRIQAQRDERDHGSGHHRAGAPARRHLLSKLAVCGWCGSPMFAHTSSYRRSDGTRARTYACRSYRVSDGTCQAGPLDAEAIDSAVIERLHDLLPDFEGWIAQIEDRHAGERARLAKVVDQAEGDRDEQARLVEAHERQHRRHVGAEDDRKADLAAEFVLEARGDLEAAETRLAATRDALASIPVEAPRDRLLDFGLSLRAAIRGRVEAAHSIEDVNRALVESFDTS